MAKEDVVVRGVEVTEELYDLIVFCVHAFVRPTTTELYALKHDDIVIETEPKRLLVTIRSGKTGFRIANTMFGAVIAYHRLQEAISEGWWRRLHLSARLHQSRNSSSHLSAVI